MSRKSCRRRVRQAKPPMLVVMSTVPSLETTLHVSLVSFREGRATTDDFDNLADCRDQLMLACADGHDDSAKAACEVGLVALQNIKIRYAETGRMGCSGEELQALVVLVEYSTDFWTRQSGVTFSTSYQALLRARKLQSSERASA